MPYLTSWLNTVRSGAELLVPLLPFKLFFLNVLRFRGVHCRLANPYLAQSLPRFHERASSCRLALDAQFPGFDFSHVAEQLEVMGDRPAIIQGRRGTLTDGLGVSEVELIGGMGAAMPAVCEPNPSFSNVLASILPEAFRPCES